MLSNILKGDYIQDTFITSFLTHLILWVICPAFRPLSPLTQYPLAIGISLPAAMVGIYTAYGVVGLSREHCGYLERLAGIYAAACAAILAAAARLAVPTIPPAPALETALVTLAFTLGTYLGYRRMKKIKARADRAKARAAYY